MRETLYIESPQTPTTHYSWRANIQMSSLLVQDFGVPIVSLFYILNICFIYVEYSFYISNICSVFQMFALYFKYLFYFSNIYSQFEIFVQYPKNLLYFKYLFCVKMALFSSLLVLYFNFDKYSLCISNIRSDLTAKYSS